MGGQPEGWPRGCLPFPGVESCLTAFDEDKVAALTRSDDRLVGNRVLVPLDAAVWRATGEATPAARAVGMCWDGSWTLMAARGEVASMHACLLPTGRRSEDRRPLWAHGGQGEHFLPAGGRGEVPYTP